MPTGSDAIGNGCFAIHTIKFALRDRSVAHGAGTSFLIRFGAIRFAYHVFDFSLVLGIDFVAIFRPHKDRSEFKGGFFQTCAMALDYSEREDRDSVARELADVSRYADEHTSSLFVQLILHEGASKDVRMKHQKGPFQLEQNFYVVRLQALVRVEQNLVRILVIAKLLLAAGNNDGSLGGLCIVPQGHVQSENIIRIFWDAIGISHQIIQQLVDKILGLRFSNNLDGSLNSRLASLNEKFERMLVLLAMSIKCAGIEKIRSRFVVMCNAVVCITDKSY